MTCIVAVKDGETVWMGSDSAVSFGETISRRRESKIVRKEEMLIGCAGSQRVLQLLRHVFQPPRPTQGSGAEEYMSSDFASAVRGCLSENGALMAGNAPQHQCGDLMADSSHLIIGYQGRIFYMDCDFSVYEPEWDFEASGSGVEVAIGALHATQGQPAEDRIRAALGAAADVIASVCAPFHIEKLESIDSKQEKS